MRKNVTRQTFTEAIKDGLITANPSDHVTIPRAIRYEAKFFSAERIQTLLAAAKDEPMHRALCIASVYGLRLSEVSD